MLSRNRTGIPWAAATASPFIGARAPCVGRVGGQLGRGPHRVVDLGGDPHGVGAQAAQTAARLATAVVRRCSRSTFRSRPLVR